MIQRVFDYDSCAGAAVPASCGPHQPLHRGLELPRAEVARAVRVQGLRAGWSCLAHPGSSLTWDVTEGVRAQDLRAGWSSAVRTS